MNANKPRLFVLKELDIPEPIPMRPQGFFTDCYDKASVKESNKLARRSVRKVVK